MYVINIVRIENKLLIINLIIGVKLSVVVIILILDIFNILSSVGVVVVSGVGN